jgi:hypothetical protein
MTVYEGVTPVMADALGHFLPATAEFVSHVPALMGLLLAHVPIPVMICCEE